jgi:hypothetical protein
MCYHLASTSQVIVRKGRVLVRIDETAAETARSGKDAVIGWIAQVLGSGAPAPTPNPEAQE